MNFCYDLTIDICVLMSGSRIGNIHYFQSSFDLMKKMESDNKFKLALDQRKKIYNQYLKKLKEGTYGHQWLILMASKKKIRIIPWKYIQRGIKGELERARFPIGTEDFNYVVTAAGTICKFLVSHDPHYSNKACRILRRKLGIRVKEACECQEL